jgi:anti-sigma regulatory factor (Ser/Thr protein kinase)
VSTVERDAPTRLAHDAFVYAGDDEYTATLVPLVRAALAAGDAVVAAVPSHRAALLRAALGPLADDVSWVDAGDRYRRPVRTIAEYARTLQALPPGTSAFVIGEVRFGTTEREWAAWTRYESALNRALAHHPARVVCPYDARTLPGSVVDDACRTHPRVLDAAGLRDSDAYVAPEALLTALARPATVPAGPPDVDLCLGDAVRDGRLAFAEAATAWGLTAAHAGEVAVAVSEVITNAVVHGGGTAWMRVWRHEHELTCVIEDAGPGTDDVLLGYIPPSAASIGGYGLWLTRQLFDHTELAPSPRGGLLVRLTLTA